MKPSKKALAARSPASSVRHVQLEARDGRAWLAGAALVGMVIVCYLHTLRAGFVWDDDIYVTNNQTLRTFDGLRRIWFEIGAVPQYYPLVHSTFWIEWHLWGNDAAGFHAVNVALHATSAVLLWRLLRRMRVTGAWLGAALFAVHPVGVESVAWITERKNVLSLVLALSSISCYLRFAPVDDSTVPLPDRKRWRFYGAALGLFCAALFSKTVVATLPAVLLVIVWWRRGRVTPRDVVCLAPFFAAGLALGSVTAWMEVHHIGATGDEWSLTWVDRVLLGGRALWFYAAKLAWPYPLVFFYPRWTIDAALWWQYVFPLAAALVLTLLWVTRRRMGRGPLAAASIFAGVLTPALGFFNVYPFRYSYVADHFQYHASVSLLALAGSGATLAARRWKPRWGTLPIAMTGVALVLLAGASVHQTFAYQDRETLFRDTIGKNPASWAALMNLSIYYARQGRQEDAFALAQRALEAAPDRPDINSKVAALIMAQAARQGFPTGKVARAQALFQKAVQLNPDDLPARTGLAFTCTLTKQFDAAEQQLAEVLRVAPKDPLALFGMGAARAGQNRWNDARDYYAAALRHKPDYFDARHNLAIAQQNLEEIPAALASFERALTLDPQRADCHLEAANLYLREKIYERALRHFVAVVKLRPTDPAARNDLGSALLAQGRADEAIPYFTHALHLQPDFAEARDNLQRARDLQRRKPAP